MGWLIIFNSETSSRIGSQHDVKTLKKAFHKLNYHIKFVKDPLLKDIRDTMELLLKENLDTARCLVVVIMTHGGNHDTAFAKDEIYNIKQEIINSKVFQKYKNLPKIVITQACKRTTSNNTHPVVPIEEANHEMIEVQNVFRFDSTFEGSYSIRLYTGSPFIKLFCEQLDKFGFELSIREVANKVMEEFSKQFNNFNSEQFPTQSFYKDFDCFDKICFGARIQRSCSSNSSALEFKEFVIG